MLAFARTGVPAFDELFGRHFWDDLDEHPEIGAQFDAIIGPTGHGHPNPSFPITGGWEAIHSVADVGRGTGAMLAGVLQLHPHLHGTLIDLPRTVALSEDREATVLLKRCARAAGTKGRVIVLGGVFPEGKPRPLTIEMVLVGGRHRTLPEFRELAHHASLDIVAAHGQDSGRMSVECRPI